MPGVYGAGMARRTSTSVLGYRLSQESGINFSQIVVFS
jgi:hypothetical protein